MGLTANLLPGWKAVRKAGSPDQVYYWREEDNTSTWEHPTDEVRRTGSHMAQSHAVTRTRGMRVVPPQWVPSSVLPPPAPAVREAPLRVRVRAAVLSAGGPQALHGACRARRCLCQGPVGLGAAVPAIGGSRGQAGGGAPGVGGARGGRGQPRQAGARNAGPRGCPERRVRRLGLQFRRRAGRQGSREGGEGGSREQQRPGGRGRGASAAGGSACCCSGVCEGRPGFLDRPRARRGDAGPVGERPGRRGGGRRGGGGHRVGQSGDNASTEGGDSVSAWRHGVSCKGACRGNLSWAWRGCARVG